MSSFDFAMTIAAGSVIATAVIGPEPQVLEAAWALVPLFIAQTLISRARRLDWVQKIVDKIIMPIAWSDLPMRLPA